MTRTLDFGAVALILLAILAGVLASFSPDIMLAFLGSLPNIGGQ